MENNLIKNEFMNLFQHNFSFQTAFFGFYPAFFSIYPVFKRHIISIYSAFLLIFQIPEFSIIPNHNFRSVWWFLNGRLILNLFHCSKTNSKFQISNSKLIPLPFLIFNLEFLISQPPRSPPTLQNKCIPNS